MLVLTPRLGEIGAALALLATEMAITITVFTVLWKMRLNPFQNPAAEPTAAS